MANITPFDFFNDVARFNPFSGGDFFKGFRMQPWLTDVNFEPQIKIDLSEDDDAYTVKAELPGVSKDDIKIEIDGKQVSISAEVKREKEEKKGKITLRSERYHGMQYRSFTLGQYVDDSKAEAKYQDGVLELKLPKKNGAARKAIKIQ